MNRMNSVKTGEFRHFFIRFEILPKKYSMSTTIALFSIQSSCFSQYSPSKNMHELVLFQSSFLNFSQAQFDEFDFMTFM